MKIKNFEKLTKNDLPKIPEDLFKLLNPVSEQIDLLTRAAQGRLTCRENLSAEEKTFPIAHDTATTIELQRVKEPIGILHLWNELGDYARVGWAKADVARVSVKVYFDSTPASNTEVTLLILGS